jgi:hypothetical protein
MPFFSKSGFCAAAAAVFIGLSLASPARADDDDRGRWLEFKQEFRDRPCKVEREQKKNGDYKEERECKGR